MNHVSEVHSGEFAHAMMCAIKEMRKYDKFSLSNF
jgi:hypothetical protein